MLYHFYFNHNWIKKVFVIITSWFGWPINGKTFALTLDVELGVTVQYVNVELNLYLIAFWLVLVKFWLTGSALLLDVIILKKLLTLASELDEFGVKYSILYPTNPFFQNYLKPSW
jgi:hypothetical protein